MSIDMNSVVDVRHLQTALGELETVTRDRAIPRAIAAALLSSTEQAFERQADPDTGKGWKSWSDPWLAWRQEHGFVPGSITTDYGQDYALIGSPKIYASIHQWGGTPDMAPRPAGVPARPYMGLDKTGEQEVFDAIRKRVSAALKQ
ncbi:phage virion morphogenesis protein [Escherichia coli]